MAHFKTLSTVPTLVVALCLGSTALAGSMDAPVTTTVAAVPPQIMTDWSGFYAGAQIGKGQTTTDFANGLVVLDLDANYYGLHAGYLHDYGTLVAGLQLSYDATSVEGSTLADDPTRLGLSALLGYDAGRVLPYAHIGVSRLSLPDFDQTETGISYGIGAKYLIKDSLMAGIEYTHTRYSDYLFDVYPTDNEATGDTISVSLAFRF